MNKKEFAATVNETIERLNSNSQFQVFEREHGFRECTNLFMERDLLLQDKEQDESKAALALTAAVIEAAKKDPLKGADTLKYIYLYDKIKGALDNKVKNDLIDGYIAVAPDAICQLMDSEQTIEVQKKLRDHSAFYHNRLVITETKNTNRIKTDHQKDSNTRYTLFYNNKNELCYGTYHDTPHTITIHSFKWPIGILGLPLEM